jgi:hypothetical protein
MNFQALMVTRMKMVIFWDIMSCNLVDIKQRFRAAYCLLPQGDEAVSSSGTSDNIYQTTWSNISEDNHLHNIWTLISGESWFRCQVMQKCNNMKSPNN